MVGHKGRVKATHKQVADDYVLYTTGYFWYGVLTQQ